MTLRKVTINVRFLHWNRNHVNVDLALTRMKPESYLYVVNLTDVFFN